MLVSRRAIRLAVLAAALAAPALLSSATSPNFVPDVVFTGSSLANWRVVGTTTWRAESGEIVATPAGDGGWLVLNSSFQDVGVFTSVRCESGCRSGLLLRAEPAPGGGMKGIFVSLTEGDMASYRVTIDSAGREVERERLRQAGGGQVRVAPPPAPPAAPPAAGAAPAGARGRGGPAGARGGGLAATPAGSIPRPDTAFHANDWNTVEVMLDANILRPLLNNTTGGLSGGVAEEEHGRYGAIALYAAGTGAVRFKDVSYKDLQPKVAAAESVSPRFRMQALNEFYYSWGPAIADFNRDGKLDIAAGPYFYLGPDYLVAREIYLAQTLNPSTEYFNGLQYAYDFTGDGWPDVVNILFTRPIVLYVNPRGESRRWDRFTITDTISSEIGLLKDVDRDGVPELLFKDSTNAIVYAKPDPQNPTGMWTKRPVTEPGPWSNHGLGVGDINGDNRVDVTNAYGWWEQPAAGAAQGPWTYHADRFGIWDRSSPGGAEMAVYNVNGDGLSDIVTSLQAHGWGLSWFEQRRTAAGAISFVEHPIMRDFSTKNAGGVTFSQLHGGSFADVDGDGIPDFVTGKRFWSHLDNFIDPDPYGPPVLYVYRTVRNRTAPGGAEFVPELIHNRSGMGSQVALVDLDNDKAVEIITSTKRGTFVFWNNWRQTAPRR